MPDRLATRLLLIARDPASGRLRRAGALDVGLRAALFTDLLLAGRITEQRGAPYAPDAEQSEDRILDAVQRAVASRPGVPWWRWFRHVRADRDALVDDLMGAGRWTEDGAVPPRFRDERADDAVALGQSMLDLSQLRKAPVDNGDAVLAALTVMCGSIAGRPRPRALRRELDPLLEPVVRSNATGAAAVPRMLRGAAMRIRRPLRR